MEKLTAGISHLFMTVFLYNFATFMVIPAITDVSMSALCPGKDECSLAIYMTGAQNAMIGLGTLVMMPLIGNLSDIHGRKIMLTLPMALTILPLGILAYSRTTFFFYAYYGLRTVTSMICEGSVQCLALAYLADSVPESRRTSSFGILSGMTSAAFVCGNLSTRFLSTAATFQVAASVALAALVYMRTFLPESMTTDGVSTEEKATDCLLDKSPAGSIKVFKTLPSLDDTLYLLRSSSTFSQAASVAFFSNLGDVGIYAALMYFLKAQFHFNKDQFADLMIINGIAGTVSQMILMPILAPAVAEETLLSVGLLFSCAHMFLYSVAWSSWVPYAAAMFSALAVFAPPCIRSIASKQVGLNEQGKAQGCITGICSFANVISPLAFSPLTAIFLSDSAPFHFPGFSIMCAGFASMIAFVQSITMRESPPVSDSETDDSNSV